jgi:NhaC family Na+:H+ antiporter
MNNVKTPSLFTALFPILVLVVLLGINVVLYGEDSSYGPNQLALLFSAAIAGISAFRLGHRWEAIQDGIVSSIGSSMSAILILLLIGALAGTWLLSGIVPAMIFYGLKILSPAIFLFAACVVCAIVAVATGSSWSTVATVGIALLGIGKAMGFNEAMVAGAIISGAYFGDKMSPLSDTTNLAPAVAGTDLFTHIRYMFYTTVPSISITLLIFLAIGFFRDSF